VPRRLALAALTALLVLAAAAPPSRAQATFAPCAPTGFECAQIQVPIDRSGQVPGTVTLAVERVRASQNPDRAAVVALAGGPGQAAIPAATDFASILGPALATRDLVVFDQRGTGRSDRLRCSAFEGGSSSIVSAAASCAGQLGAARGFFRSADSVEDIEAIRVQSGYEKLVLFGVSYGTKVALDYAARFPERTEALLLDSIVPPEGSDVFNRSTFRAVGRALRELCGSGACRGISAQPSADLRTLVQRTNRRSLRGTVNDVSGRELRVSLTPLGLFEIMLAGDLNPTLRAELPGSLRSALRGDLRPILRLRARAAGLSGIATQAPATAADSDALFAATRCEESVFPWSRYAGPEERARSAVRAARGLPRRDVAPFTYREALNGEVIPLCLGWPNAAPEPAAPAALPPVRTLILSGNADLRTPVEDGRSVAARLGGAGQLVGVPFTGHSVLGSDLSDCATTAVRAFFETGQAGTCSGSRQVFTPTPVAPTSASRVPGRDRVRKTLEALRLTILDVRRQFIGDALAAGRATPNGSRAAGLRSGRATWTASGISFRRVEYVPGVTVGGVRPHADGATASYSIAGRGALLRGTVRIDASGRATGTLGGRRVRVRLARASAAALRGGAPEHLHPFPRLTRLS